MSQKTRVIIAGGRDFNIMVLVEIAMMETFECNYTEIELVGGGANGADALGKRFAKEHGIPYKEFPADWGTYHNAAGPIRNRQMARYATETGFRGILIAFWDGKSRGTKHMIDTATELGMEVKVIAYGDLLRKSHCIK